MIGATPFEALLGHNPDVSNLKFFGSKSWDIIPTKKTKAFQYQSSKCILLGYVEDAKAYKLMELATRKCFIEHSFQLEEDHLLDPPQYEAQGGINTLSFPLDDDILSHVSDSNNEEQDQHDLDIEVVPHENLDPNPAPIPNQLPKPKWTQNTIEAAGDGAGNS